MGEALLLSFPKNCPVLPRSCHHTVTAIHVLLCYTHLEGVCRAQGSGAGGSHLFQNLASLACANALIDYNVRDYEFFFNVGRTM